MLDRLHLTWLEVSFCFFSPNAIDDPTSVALWLFVSMSPALPWGREKAMERRINLGVVHLC